MKTFNISKNQSDKLFPVSRTTTPNIRCASRDTFKNIHSRLELKSRQASEEVLHSMDFISPHFKQMGQDMIKKSLFIKKKETARARKKNASQEMTELQKSMAQAMDRSKEKFKRQGNIEREMFSTKFSRRTQKPRFIASFVSISCGWNQ